MAADRPGAPTRVVPDDPGRDWTQPGVYEVRPGLYRIPLPLPQDGLRAVNVYAVRDGAAIVLVDSGWAVPAAHDQLRRALRALDAGEDRISRILVTHTARIAWKLMVSGERYDRARAEAREGLGAAQHRGSAPSPSLHPHTADHGASTMTTA